jgi:hypothetical protein
VIIRSARGLWRGAHGDCPPLLLRDLDDITAFRRCASKTGVNGTRRCRFDLNNLLLAIEWLRAQVSCKKEGEGEDVSHAFWGVSVAALGRLVFKIAERM